jgi:hypothetical protein
MTDEPATSDMQLFTLPIGWGSTSKWRATIQGLLGEAGRAELQLAYKLLKALLR